MDGSESGCIRNMALTQRKIQFDWLSARNAAFGQSFDQVQRIAKPLGDLIMVLQTLASVNRLTFGFVLPN